MFVTTGPVRCLNGPCRLDPGTNCRTSSWSQRRTTPCRQPTTSVPRTARVACPRYSSRPHNRSSRPPPRRRHLRAALNNNILAAAGVCRRGTSPPGWRRRDRVPVGVPGLAVQHEPPLRHVARMGPGRSRRSMACTAAPASGGGRPCGAMAWCGLQAPDGRMSASLKAAPRPAMKMAPRTVAAPTKACSVLADGARSPAPRRTRS